VKPAGPLGLSPPTPGDVGGLNQPNSQGQYNFVTADMRTPSHPGFRPGHDDKPANFQLQAGGQQQPPGTWYDQIPGTPANQPLQLGIPGERYAGAPNSVSSVGGKFGSTGSQPLPFEKPQFSGQQIADRIAQKPGFFGPNLYNPRNQPTKPGPPAPAKDRIEELFAGRYETDGTGRIFPSQKEKDRRREYAASTEGRANTARLAENAAKTKAARETSLASRRANVTANAKERRALRQERIAQKANPGVANRFFGNQQELAMQGLRNQGALGVAQENAKGDIARNEALAKFQQAQLAIRAAEAGVPNPLGGPGGTAAPKPATEAPKGSGAELAGQPDDVVKATLEGLPPETQKRVLAEKAEAEKPWLDRQPVYPFVSPGARTRGEAIGDAFKFFTTPPGMTPGREGVAAAPGKDAAGFPVPDPSKKKKGRGGPAMGFNPFGYLFQGGASGF
jgi:hypothetical protein